MIIRKATADVTFLFYGLRGVNLVLIEKKLV